MSFVIRPATVEDVPTILKFIIELAVYEKLAHEVVATEEILRSTLFGPKQYPHLILSPPSSPPPLPLPPLRSYSLIFLFFFLLLSSLIYCSIVLSFSSPSSCFIDPSHLLTHHIFTPYVILYPSTHPFSSPLPFFFLLLVSAFFLFRVSPSFSASFSLYPLSSLLSFSSTSLLPSFFLSLLSQKRID